jgi:5-methylcytosine-specific restriction endonuclease McrA
MNKKQIRDEFRNAVFERDHNKCVVCDSKAVDAHHITDRTELPAGGYVVENGVSLCAICHRLAEKYHQTLGKDWVAGFHPRDLYTKINSSYDIAYYASLKLERELL